MRALPHVDKFYLVIWTLTGGVMYMDMTHTHTHTFCY